MLTKKFFISLLFTLILGCNSTKGNKSQQKQAISGVYGIDVSHHQGDINWKHVKHWNNHKVEFVYIKATEGATYLDKKYKRNFIEAKREGLKVGSYHYFRTTSTPHEQFINFIKHVDHQQQDLIPMIDLEENKSWSTDKYNKNLKVFLALVEEKYNRKPILYSTQRFYNTYLKNRYLSYYWNIGRYSSKQPYLLDENKWSMWQFSDTETVEGISKQVDVNMLSERMKVADLEL